MFIIFEITIVLFQAPYHGTTPRPVLTEAPRSAATMSSVRRTARLLVPVGDTGSLRPKNISKILNSNAFSKNFVQKLQMKPD